MALPSSLLTKSTSPAMGILRMTISSSPAFRSPATSVQEGKVPVRVNEVLSRFTSREFHTTTVRNQKRPMKQYYDKAEAMMRRTTDEMAAKLRAAKDKKRSGFKEPPSDRGQAGARRGPGWTARMTWTTETRPSGRLPQHWSPWSCLWPAL